MLNTSENRVHYPVPTYADFPRQEYENRRARARSQMEQEGMDVLVIWDRLNVRYFSGFHSEHWHAESIQPAVYILPLNHDPIIIVPDFFRGVAEGLTYENDIRGQIDPHFTKEIRELPIEVANVIKGLGYSRGRIGIESGELGGMHVPRPINDIDKFRSELSDANFVDACHVIWNCRMIKSSLEVDAIARATQAVVDSYGELVGNFKLGMSEREVGILIQQHILGKAHELESANIRCTAHRYPMPDTPPYYDGVTITEGDRMVVEPIASYKGYMGSCCRTFQVGELPPQAQHSVKIIERAQSEAIDVIKDGVMSNQVTQAIQRAFKEEGSECQIEMAGHGIGLGGHEPPALNTHDDWELKEGMVLAIEVWKYDIAGFTYGDTSQAAINLGPFANEDLVVVTKDGCDRLPAFRKDILSLY